MVGSIKNRIAAFEDMALKSKSSSQLMSILPPEHGFAASKNRSAIFGPGVKGKETSGYVPPPVKTERKQKLKDSNEVGQDRNNSLGSQIGSNNNPINRQISLNRSKQQSNESDLENQAKEKETPENSSNGPISMISITSSESKHSNEDSHSVSPLSFQGENVPSKGGNSRVSVDDDNLDIIKETASESSTEGSRASNKLDRESIDDMKENKTGVLNNYDATFDTNTENDIQKQEFISRESSNDEEEHINDESTLSDMSSDGPIIHGQEDYDNFTLGSGESDATPDDKSPIGSRYGLGNMKNVETGEMTDDFSDRSGERIDSFHVDDNIRHSTSDNPTDEKSFSDYVANMRPVPSFHERDEENNDIRLNYDDERYGDGEGNNYVSGDEDDVDLDDLSEKVYDDVLNSGGRHVQEIIDENFDEYIDGNDNADDADSNGLNQSMTHRNKHGEGNPMRNGGALRIEHTGSPVYYPEEDFKEDDEDLIDFDSVATDDETGDLLGINIEELSHISDEKGIGSANLSMNRASKEIMKQSSSSYSSSTSSTSAKGKNNIYRWDLDANQDSAKIEKHKYPLTLIQEEQTTFMDHDDHNYFAIGQTPLYHDASSPMLTIRSDSNRLSTNDEMSQITESTYDVMRKIPKRRTSYPQDVRTHASQSDQSVITYSLNESHSSMMVRRSSNQSAPIFRDRNSLSKNLKLNSTSTISEITDPLSMGTRHKTYAQKRIGTSTNNANQKRTPTVGVNPSPSGIDHLHNHDKSSISLNSKKSGTSQNTKQSGKADGDMHRGRQKKPGVSGSRGFSLRSLSPFRRKNSRAKVDKELLRAQNEFRREQAKAKLEGNELKLSRSYSTSGSTPGDILKEEEDREISVPLVAVSPSYDSTERQVVKKKFSLRSLSPFRRFKSKRTSNRKKIDPFDEGNGSF